jgi:hypothetical protein|tara:strand:+ start:143 stop:352 length:210 start_codon:yes stop_codon:yes gene_type:complete
MIGKKNYKTLKNGGNTSRMNKLEELGRVDSEKAFTSKGKRNLKDEKKRIVGALKRRGGGIAKRGMGIAK